MSFKNKKYKIVKNAVSKELSDFIYKYFLLKREVFKTFRNTKYISPFELMVGTFEDIQVPNTYSHYADIAMETLLVKVMPIVEHYTELKLNPNYSFARLYKKGDILKRHKDRFSCEISCTLNLGGDEWPIYLDPTGKENSKNFLKINLKQGDMLIYRGIELEHWREIFNGDICGQVFLHYNDSKTKNSEENIFDRRPHLGLPSSFKK